MQWVSNRNTLLCLLLLSWVINYCALVSFNPCPDEKRNVQPSFSPRLMFRLAPSFEGFVASLKNLQYNFPKMRGGGSKAVWNFSENSSILEGKGVPYSGRALVKTLPWGNPWAMKALQYSFGAQREWKASCRAPRRKARVNTLPWGDEGVRCKLAALIRRPARGCDIELSASSSHLLKMCHVIHNSTHTHVTWQTPPLDFQVIFRSQNVAFIRLVYFADTEIWY